MRKWLRKTLASSRIATRAALRLRNVAEAVINTRLDSGTIMGATGEQMLIRSVAPWVRTVVDVGANRGDWTDSLLELAPECQVILIEPATSGLKILHERFRGKPNVRIVECALGEKSGTFDFYEEPDAGSESSLVPRTANARATLRRVRVTTLDGLLGDLNSPNVDLLKIDAEGFDLAVLRGADLALGSDGIPIVQWEYSPKWLIAGHTLCAALDLMRARGYANFMLHKDGLFDFDYRTYGEFESLSNFVSITPACMERLAALRRGPI